MNLTPFRSGGAPRRRLRWLAVAVLLLGSLVACTAESDSEDPGPPSTAGTAPESAFTVDCPTWSEPVSDPAGDVLPGSSLECLGSKGVPVSLSGQPELPTLVNMWATWCAPCVTEMPLLNEFAALADGKVAVLGVATLDTRSAATAFAADNALIFPSVLDPDAGILNALGPPAMPNSALIAPDGTIAYVHIGPYDSVAEIVADVQDKLGVSI